MAHVQGPLDASDGDSEQSDLPVSPVSASSILPLYGDIPVISIRERDSYRNVGRSVQTAEDDIEDTVPPQSVLNFFESLARETTLDLDDGEAHSDSDDWESSDEDGDYRCLIRDSSGRDRWPSGRRQQLRLQGPGSDTRIKAAQRAALRQPHLKSFPQFQRLPLELRLHIWELYCPDVWLPHRVLQLTLTGDGTLAPQLTMDQQTCRLRRFMRICRETRTRGLQAFPDTLPIYSGMGDHCDNAILRCNAERDIFHMDQTDRAMPGYWRTKATDSESSDDDSECYSDSDRQRYGDDDGEASPYTAVRNLCISDIETRSRDPGSYLDHYGEDTVIVIIGPDDASHRAPREICSPAYADGLQRMFPCLDCVYVAEPATRRRINAWVGDRRPNNHAEFRIRIREHIPQMTMPLAIDFVYCWHDPPATWLTAREAERRQKRKRPTLMSDAEGAEASGDTKVAVAETKPPVDDKPFLAIEGDFCEDVVVNHVSSLRRTGVRFARMLMFELQNGLAAYKDLREDCGPFGDWPVDQNGVPIDDDPSLASDDDDDEESYGNSYESSGIDDDPILSEEDEDEDDLGVVDDDSDESVDDDSQDDSSDLYVVRQKRARGEADTNDDTESVDDNRVRPRPRYKRRRVVESDEEE